MKQGKVQLMALALAGALVSTASLAGVPTAMCRAHGQAALQAWTQGRDAALNQYMAPVISAHVSAAQWQQAWAATQVKFGAFRHAGKLASHTVMKQGVLAAEVVFAKATQALIVQCDDKDRINTFRLIPAGLVKGMLTQAGVPLPAGAVSRDISVPSPLGPLPGKLVVPAGSGPFPAVVLVQGSGSTNYDEAIGPNKPFRDIAMGLAKAGVATLRYDKRPFVYGKKMMANAKLTVDDEVTDDALTALHLLARQSHVDPRRVFVLGHSLGAMMAPRIATRDPALAGVIMLAAPTRPLLTVLAEQIREMGTRQGMQPATIAAREASIAAERKLLDDAKAAQPPTGRWHHIPQSYWLSLHDYHQVAVAKKLAMPMLILQGESDFNVSYTKDFVLWKKALAGHAHVTFHAYPGLSHLFMPAKATATASDFAPGHVSPEVIADMAAWIKAQPARQP